APDETRTEGFPPRHRSFRISTLFSALSGVEPERPEEDGPPAPAVSWATDGRYELSRQATRALHPQAETRPDEAGDMAPCGACRCACVGGRRRGLALIG